MGQKKVVRKIHHLYPAKQPLRQPQAPKPVMALSVILFTTKTAKCQNFDDVGQGLRGKCWSQCKYNKQSLILDYISEFGAGQSWVEGNGVDIR